jgi:hypothetical protein
MKYLKTYNESLRDKMKPKSDEEIFSKLNKLSNVSILQQSLKNEYLKGIQYVLDNNRLNYRFLDLITNSITFITNVEILKYLLENKTIKNYLGKNTVYLIEKYKLGLHQNEIKDFENYIIKELEYTNIENDGNINYKKNDKNVLVYDEDEKEVIIDTQIKTMLYDKYNFSAKMIAFFIKNIIKKIFNLDIKTITYNYDFDENDITYENYNSTYDYIKVSNELKHAYKFETEDNDVYVVNIFNYGKIQGKKSLDGVYTLEFGVKGQKESNAIMNKGRIFKVMNTMKEIIKDFTNEVKPKEIRINPERNYKNDRRRYDIFVRYIQQNLPSEYKLEKSINWLTKEPSIKIIKK